MLFSVQGCYGSDQTPSNIFVIQEPRGFGFWYCVEGSKNVNLTYTNLYEMDFVYVEELTDSDTFYNSKPIESEKDLEEAVNS